LNKSIQFYINSQQASPLDTLSNITAIVENPFVHCPNPARLRVIFSIMVHQLFLSNMYQLSVILWTPSRSESHRVFDCIELELGS